MAGAGEDPTWAQRRDLVRAAADALAGVEDVLHQGVGAELGPFFAELDVLRRRCDAAQVATLAEALEIALKDCPGRTQIAVASGSLGK